MDDRDSFYFAQVQHMVQYGPLNFSQFHDLYQKRIFDDHTVICKSSSSSFPSIKNNFKIQPNSILEWKAIKSWTNLLQSLSECDILQTRDEHKTRQTYGEPSFSNNSNTTITNTNSAPVQVHLNMNMTTNTMNMNMNITNTNANNSTNGQVNEQKWLHLQRELETISMKNEVQKAKIEILNDSNHELEKELLDLKNNHSQHLLDMQSKMHFIFDEYKVQSQNTNKLLKLEIHRLKARMQRKGSSPLPSSPSPPSLSAKEKIAKLRKEIKELMIDKQALEISQKKKFDDYTRSQFDIQYYNARYKALEVKYDLELFAMDKKRSIIMEIKQDLIHKDSILLHAHQMLNCFMKNCIISESTDVQLRLSDERIDDLLCWHNFQLRFYQCLDIIEGYQLSSQRSRIRMRNVVSMLGEKIKSLNINDLEPLTLIVLSRDLKKSFESIASEQHLKEFELSTHKQRLLLHSLTSMNRMEIENHLSVLKKRIMNSSSYSSMLMMGSDTSLCSNCSHRKRRTSSIRSTNGMGSSDSRHHYRNMSYSSLASITSVSCLSPSLNGNEDTNIISQHKKKRTFSLSGSGLKLLTDPATLKSYLQPITSRIKNTLNSRQKKISTPTTTPVTTRPTTPVTNASDKQKYHQYSHYSCKYFGDQRKSYSRNHFKLNSNSRVSLKSLKSVRRDSLASLNSATSISLLSTIDDHNIIIPANSVSDDDESCVAMDNSNMHILDESFEIDGNGKKIERTPCHSRKLSAAVKNPRTQMYKQKSVNNIYDKNQKRKMRFSKNEMKINIKYASDDESSSVSTDSDDNDVHNITPRSLDNDSDGCSSSTTTTTVVLLSPNEQIGKVMKFRNSRPHSARTRDYHNLHHEKYSNKNIIHNLKQHHYSGYGGYAYEYESGGRKNSSPKKRRNVYYNNEPKVDDIIIDIVDTDEEEDDSLVLKCTRNRSQTDRFNDSEMPAYEKRLSQNVLSFFAM